MDSINRIDIPPKLVSMLKARRVIPFLGAGFSAGLGLPEWEELLAKVASEIGGDIPYHEVKSFCNDDYLQIAEYYFLMSDHRIGPLRHAISTAFSKNSVNLAMSPPHVELVNLGT